MSTIITRTRGLLAALALLVIVSPIGATVQPSRRTQATESAHVQATTVDAGEALPPAGSPEFGILIIIGIVGVLILIAWLFSRVGSEGPEASDGSII